MVFMRYLLILTSIIHEDFLCSLANNAVSLNPRSSPECFVSPVHLNFFQHDFILFPYNPRSKPKIKPTQQQPKK